MKTNLQTLHPILGSSHQLARNCAGKKLRDSANMIPYVGIYVYMCTNNAKQCENRSQLP